jgi:siroheme synthase-like protein
MGPVARAVIAADTPGMNAPRFALPISLDVSGRRCLVLGGGAEATDKARRLYRAGASTQVIASSIEEELSALARAGLVTHTSRRWEPQDLEGAFLVVATQDEYARAEELWQLAAAQRFLLSVIDDPAHSTYANPAVLEVEDLRVALSSGGRAPAVLKRMREDLQTSLDTDVMRSFLRRMAEERERTPKGERFTRLRELVGGFALEVTVRFPGWFQPEVAPGEER